MDEFQKSRGGPASGSYEQHDISSLQACVDDAFNTLVVRCPEMAIDPEKAVIIKGRLAQAVIEGKKLDLSHEDLMRFALSAIPEGRRLWR
jgi:hypothetical protein